MSKYGDTREDGFRFWGTSRGKPVWLSPKSFHKQKMKSRKYARKYRCPGGDGNKRGRAAELFVRSYLLTRGFDTTTPDSPGSKHDLHVELPSVGWKGVQVKVARLNTKTGYVSKTSGSKNFHSPITAWVVLEHNKIYFVDGTEKLPKELQ